jgi:hypothetical protein
MVENKDWDGLNRIDELQRALTNKECLVGYKTLPCNFPPTFKVERKAGYEYIDKRRPSYTDRVLWKAGHQLDDNIRPLAYEPIDEFASSDHKPIRAAFAIKLNEAVSFRPRMTRRRSVMKLSGVLRSKKLKSSHVVAHKERFHLFVSDIHCTIYGKDSKNPYLCLVSDPAEALQQEVKKKWKRLLKKLFLKRNRRDSGLLTAKGFPRSTTLKNTNEADWRDEEIHSEVITHRSDGSSIDLTGAILRLTVMDNRQSIEDVHIGSFAFNLVKLIKACQPSTQESSMDILGRLKEKKTEKPTLSGNRFASIRMVPRRMSVLNIFRLGSNDKAEEEGFDFTDNDPIESVDVDTPILKNGVETGRLRCKIEAWWMDESTAKAFGGHFAAKSTGSSRRNGAGSSSLNFFTPRKQTKREQQIQAVNIFGRRQRSDESSRDEALTYPQATPDNVLDGKED